MKPTNSQTLPETDASSTAPATRRRPLFARWSSYLYRRRRRVCEGLALGALFGLCAWVLGINELLHYDILQDVLIVPSLAGVVLALSPGRRILHAAVCAIIAVLCVVAYTPVTGALMPSLQRADPLERLPAMVILSSGFHKDNSLDATGQQRVVHGFMLMKQGAAETMVLTRAVPSIGDQVPAITAEMRALGLDFPIETVGPVADTHDEAVQVARLARALGWKRVILVTQPWHMQRARALFKKQGLDVLCSPCAEPRYDMTDLTLPRGRLSAFRDWLHEAIGMQVYRFRGWV